MSIPQYPWWQTAVFYEVFVRSFADSDGDGIGDFDGLREHLGDIGDGGSVIKDGLGATALWLMPVAKSPSYHGYDVTSYTAVEPDYGDLDSFKALIAEAHQRNMKVVIDFEANHTSSEHPWFRDALGGGKHRDWYVWSDTDPGWPNPIGAGDPWRPSENGYYYALFWEGMPDLNLRNPAVTKELEKVAQTWLDLGVDGFRIDAARHLIEDGADQQVNTPETHAWLQAFRTDVHASDTDAINGTRLVVGEVADAERTSGGYVTDGSLDMAFDFEFCPAVMNAVSHGDASSLLTTEGSIGKAYPNGGAGTFLSNHDQARVMSQLRGDATAARLSAETLLTAPGTPFIYYGEELGMTGPKPDEQIRTPYPWTADGPGFGFTTGTPWEAFGEGAATANAATEAADPSSLLTTYADLAHLRHMYRDLAVAPFVPLDSSTPGIAASLRNGQGGNALLVIQNLRAEDATGVTFTSRAGALCGTPSAGVLYPESRRDADVADPQVTPTGGLAGYQPLATIPGSTTLVLLLGEKGPAIP
jgi:glycosidase